MKLTKFFIKTYESLDHLLYNNFHDDIEYHEDLYDVLTALCLTEIRFPEVNNERLDSFSDEADYLLAKALVDFLKQGKQQVTLSNFLDYVYTFDADAQEVVEVLYTSNQEDNLVDEPTEEVRDKPNSFEYSDEELADMYDNLFNAFRAKYGSAYGSIGSGTMEEKLNDAYDEIHEFFSNQGVGETEDVFEAIELLDPDARDEYLEIMNRLLNGTDEVDDKELSPEDDGMADVEYIPYEPDPRD